MAEYFSFQRDALDNLLATHQIHAGDDEPGEEKITIGRLAVHLGQSPGVGLVLGRVHALSAVRRRRALYLSPPRPLEMVGRSTELETLYQILSDFKTADLYGPDGAGKSALAAALVPALDIDHFPDGVVFVTCRIRHQDLLQILFDSFYESDSPVKITSGHAPSYLHNLRALVILDDVNLGPTQVDPILDALGNSAVLIVGSERTAVGRGHAVPLKGLPRKEAVALFEKVLRRALTSDEHPIVEQICATLNDMPLPVSCVAAQAMQDQVSLTKLLGDLQGRKSWAGPGGDLAIGPSLEQVVVSLDAAERQLLTLIAAFAGPTVSSEALQRLTNLSAAVFQRHVERLQGLGLLLIIEPEMPGLAPRLTLPTAFYRAVRVWLVDEAARLEVVNYYVSRLSKGGRLPGFELSSLLGAIEDCAHNGWLDALKLLVRAADRSLAWLGWWAEWEHVLDLTRRAAQTGEDRVLEAWAIHQLGTLEGALLVFPNGPLSRVPDGLRQGPSSAERATRAAKALRLLQTAVSIRQALGDEVGAALSAHNLQVLDHLLPAPVEETAPQESLPASPEEETDDSREETDEPLPSPSKVSRTTRSKVGLSALVALVMLAVVALGLRFVLLGGEGDGGSTGMVISWEFGDAWNALDNQTWTQQIIIVVENGDGDYQYFVDGEPVGEMFEVTLPLCDGSRGTIQVESDDGQTAQTEYEFDSPFCR